MTIPDKPNIEKDDSANDSIVIRPISQIDYPFLVHLGGEALGTNWSEAFLSWKYDSNPAGPVYGAFATVDGKPAGFYSNIPIRMLISGASLLGAQAVDAAVIPEARRLGLFVRLAEDGYQRMDLDGLVLDYAFPNPISEAGFINRLAWLRVGPVPRYVKILELKKLASDEQTSSLKSLAYRIIIAANSIALKLTGASPLKGQPITQPDVVIRQVQGFDQRVNHLWKKCSAAFPAAVLRDQEYLTWRYVANPLKQYRILIAERGADLAGYLVVSLRDYESKRIAAIAELLVAPDDESAGSALLATAENLARELGCSQIQAWMLPQHTFYTGLLRHSGFMHLPYRWAPGLLKYTIPFIIRTRAGWQAPIDLCNSQNWYLSMGDHDYY